MPRQTTVQESRSIRFGSGKFEVYDENGSGWVDLGAMRDIQFEELWERVRVMSDNAGAVSVGIREHRAALQGNMMELNLENLHLIRGGLDEYSTEAGGTETTDQEVSKNDWSFDKFIKLKNQNPDKSEITINEVKGNDTAYTEVDGDYIKVQDAAGNWGIIVLEDGVNTDAEHNLTIEYEYTETAKKIFESGGRISINPRAVRVTNYDEENKMFRITVHKAEIEEGINIEFPASDEEDPAMTEIRLEGEVDQTKDVGKQLFKIEDEQTA